MCGEQAARPPQISLFSWSMWELLENNKCALSPFQKFRLPLHTVNWRVCEWVDQISLITATLEAVCENNS